MVMTSWCNEVIMDDDLVLLFEVAWESRFGYWPRSTSRHIAHCLAAGGKAPQRPPQRGVGRHGWSMLWWHSMVIASRCDEVIMDLLWTMI